MESNTDWQAFLALVKQMKTTEQLDHFFKLFFTHEERQSLVTRYLIVKELLLEQLPQRDIAKKLGVSIAKITRGSNELKITSPDLKKQLAKLM